MTGKHESLPPDQVKDSEESVSLSPDGDISILTDHLFRHEAGKLVSVLTGIFGINRLHLAEDVVQEALAKALQTWPYYGVPKNPAAWLMQTSKNLVLDVVRRERNFQDKQERIITHIEQWGGDFEKEISPQFDEEIRDNRLRLMFACCHPLIPPESQIALALKTLCGFSPIEIAKAFLTSEAAISKRLTRAKQRIREEQIPFEIPAGEELQDRLDSVLQSLYLLFNEGYKASVGETLIRRDLCDEAMRLTALLAAHPAGDRPEVHALLALMLLNGSRLRARIDVKGKLIRLQDQDRSQWDRSMIARGLMHLTRSAIGSEVTRYHLQAGITACHCAAPDYASTDWSRILSLYDQLVAMDDSPVVALNRGIVVARLNGPKAGLKVIGAIKGREKLEDYHLYHAVLGELASESGDPAAAAGHFRRSLKLAGNKSELAFLSDRFRACEEAMEAV